MSGVGVGSGAGVGVGVGSGVGAGVGSGVGAGVGFGFGFGFCVGVGAAVGVGVRVGVGAGVAVGRGVAEGAAVGARVGSTVVIGTPGDPETAGSSGTPCVPEAAVPVMSEPVAPLEIGPGWVPLAPALAPGPGVAPAAGDLEVPGIALPADGSDAAAAAPAITILAASGPPDAGNAGDRIPVAMTTAMTRPGIRATATAVTERFSTIGP